jgi:hypothetical protein
MEGRRETRAKHSQDQRAIMAVAHAIVVSAFHMLFRHEPVRSKYSKRFYDTVHASVSEACTGRPRPAKPCASHLSSHVIIRVLHRQVLCVSDVVQLHVGGDEDELADSTGRQLSMDD